MCVCFGWLHEEDGCMLTAHGGPYCRVRYLGFTGEVELLLELSSDQRMLKVSLHQSSHSLTHACTSELSSALNSGNEERYAIARGHQ